MQLQHMPCRWEDTPAFSLQTPDHQPRAARVIDVHDGDTITVALPNPVTVQAYAPVVRINVRLVGIDACELLDPDPEKRDRARAAHARTLANVLGGSPYAWTVADAACAMDAGRRRAIREALQQHVAMVELRCGPFDKYGRLLARVAVLGGCPDLSEDLLRDGLATPFGAS
jgi:endonuclease YncB( thermonuclease family)